MYITITNIKGEKTICLNSIISDNNEICLSSFFSENIKYIFPKRLTIEHNNNKKIILKGVHTYREINSLITGDKFDSLLSLYNRANDVEIINKLKNITELRFLINEIDNSDSIVDESYSNVVYNYYLIKYEGLTYHEPINRNYIKLKSNISSFTISIQDQNGNTIDDSLGIDVTIHIKKQ